jgi:hypothetical protein
MQANIHYTSSRIASQLIALRFQTRSVWGAFTVLLLTHVAVTGVVYFTEESYRFPKLTDCYSTQATSCLALSGSIYASCRKRKEKVLPGET